MNGGRRRRYSNLCSIIRGIVYFIAILGYTKAQFIMPQRTNTLSNNPSIIQSKVNGEESNGEHHTIISRQISASRIDNSALANRSRTFQSRHGSSSSLTRTTTTHQPIVDPRLTRRIYQRDRSRQLRAFSRRPVHVASISMSNTSTNQPSIQRRRIPIGKFRGFSTKRRQLAFRRPPSPPIAPPMVAPRRVLPPPSRRVLRPPPLPALNFGRQQLSQNNGPLNLRAPITRPPPIAPNRQTPIAPKRPITKITQRHSSRRRKPLSAVVQPTTNQSKGQQINRVTSKPPTVPSVQSSHRTTLPSSQVSGHPSFQQVDTIEAGILKAVIDSSSTTVIPPSTLRARTHRLRASNRRPQQSPRQRVDSIEEAVLKAVIDSTLTSSIPKPENASTTTSSASVQLPKNVSSAKELVTTSSTLELFPAFATRPSTTRRHRLSFRPSSRNITSTTVPTITTITTNTTESPVTNFTIDLPEIVNVTTTTNAAEAEDSEEHQLHEIEENIIATLNAAPVEQSLVPPEPLPAPESSLALSAGPPGSMPPSDDIVNELNDANNFMEVAERLKLIKRLLK